MNFEQALKRLAEKEPEKFKFDGGRYLYKKVRAGYKYVLSVEGKITQDTIDEILALIGWEYWHQRWRDGWGIFAERTDTPPLTGDSIFLPDLAEPFLPKLDAAKAAIIAIIEKEYE